MSSEIQFHQVRTTALTLIFDNTAIAELIEFMNPVGTVVMLQAVHYVFGSLEARAGQSTVGFGLTANLTRVPPGDVVAFEVADWLFARALHYSNQGAANQHVNQRDPIIVPLYGLAVPSTLRWIVRNDSGLSIKPWAEIFYTIEKVSQQVANRFNRNDHVGL